MAASVDHLQHQLAGVRTGRANPGLLESIPVEAYGEKLPLKACGTVTVRSPQMLAVSVFDSEVSHTGVARPTAVGKGQGDAGGLGRLLPSICSLALSRGAGWSGAAARLGSLLMWWRGGADADALT
jgi:hypothetical protein